MLRDTEGERRSLFGFRRGSGCFGTNLTGQGRDGRGEGERGRSDTRSVCPEKREGGCTVLVCRDGVPETCPTQEVEFVEVPIEGVGMYRNEFTMEEYSRRI